MPKNTAYEVQNASYSCKHSAQDTYSSTSPHYQPDCTAKGYSLELVTTNFVG